MALPWLAVGKLVLANIDTIVGVAKPLLTRSRADSPASQADLLNQQISELQTAAVANAERIRELAEQLRQVALALEQVRRLALAALAVSVVTLGALIVSALVR
jgi:hypothetical protein